MKDLMREASHPEKMQIMTKMITMMACLHHQETKITVEEEEEEEEATKEDRDNKDNPKTIRQIIKEATVKMPLLIPLINLQLIIALL